MTTTHTPIVVGLVGGIGSGKSYVARLFEKLGCPTYDCDTQAKRLMNTDVALMRQLQDLFGTELYADGTLNRQRLAQIIFTQPQQRIAANAVIHPAVRRDFACWVTQQRARVVLVESAILIESDLYTMVDKIVAIYAPQEVRISRAMARDGITRAQVLERIQAQLPDETLRCHADFVINNDGRTPLIPQIECIMNAL